MFTDKTQQMKGGSFFNMILLNMFNETVLNCYILRPGFAAFLCLDGTYSERAGDDRSESSFRDIQEGHRHYRS